MLKFFTPPSYILNVGSLRLDYIKLHKKWSFPLRIFSANLTKSESETLLFKDFLNIDFVSRNARNTVLKNCVSLYSKPVLHMGKISLKNKFSISAAQSLEIHKS